MLLLKEEGNELLFDQTGRRIPPSKMREYVGGPDRRFTVKRAPINDFAERLGRLEFAFECSIAVSPKEFQDTFFAEKEAVEDIGINHGACLPLVIPMRLCHEARSCYERCLVEVLLPAAKRAYEAEFTGRRFNNNRGTVIRGQDESEMCIVPFMRHGDLIENGTKRDLIVSYYPNSLQGYSRSAACEQIFSLPLTFAMSGAIDGIIALIMYPDVLSDNFCVGNVLPAVCWRRHDGGCRSLCFRARDDSLSHGHDALGTVTGQYSAGLTFMSSSVAQRGFIE